MITVNINNRPFASDFITGMMLPDGIFEASIGRLQLNTYFTNTGTGALTDVNLYLESTSHPGLIVTPVTHHLPKLQAGASILQQWEVNISGAPVGKHLVSFIAENPTGRTRIIKRIFVTRVNFNQALKTFSLECTEGKITIGIKELYDSNENQKDCSCKKSFENKIKRSDKPFKDVLDQLQKLEINDFKDCLPHALLIKSMNVSIAYTPGFEGQYGELPFQDPWWKTVLTVLAIILVIAAIVVAIIFGAPFIAGIAGIGAIIIGGAITCCSVPFIVSVGLAASALASYFISSLADARDPFRRGQDNTLPGEQETTVREILDVEFDYIDPIELGKPYKIGTNWTYSRITQDSNGVERSYPFHVAEVNTNQHTLSHYQIEAPDVVRVYLQKKKPFIVKARFYDKNKDQIKGEALFVKCFMQRKSDNKIITFIMDDSGTQPDAKPTDGQYTGTYEFNEEDDGFWKLYVIAQDINNAKEDMTPDEAAQIIGGMVLTNQLTITYSGGTCPLVPDADVHVIG